MLRVRTVHTANKPVTININMLCLTILPSPVG